MATSINVKNIGNRDEFPTRRIVVKFSKRIKTSPDIPEVVEVDYQPEKKQGISAASLEEINKFFKNVSDKYTPELEPIVVEEAEGKEIILNETSNDVDIKVKLSRNYGGIDPKATVSICNLSQSIINQLATIEFAPKWSRTITVYAGYETKGQETSDIPLLFSGTILWAIPTTGRPDVWFTIQAVEQFFEQNAILKIENKSIEPKSAFAPFFVAQTAVFCGYKKSQIDLSYFNQLYRSSQPNRLKEYMIADINNYSYNSTFGNFLKKEVFQWGRMSAAQMSDKLILLPCSADMDFLENDEDKSTLPVISARSNPTMIGIPKPNPTGVDFTTLFDTSVLLPMRRFRLNSFIFPMFDDFVYWVQKVDYDLHLRGQPFYNHVVARRKVQRAK